MLKLYNTLSRKKEKFKSIKDGRVGMYVCGPTVNGVPHLGHARSQICFDVLRRYLEFLGYKVKFVSNVTDIEDKIIAAAGEEGVGIDEFSERNLKVHLEDYGKLNVKVPDVQPRATEYVGEMIDLVERLVKKGFGYFVEGDGVYFDISKFDGYGKLSHQKIENLAGGKRVAVASGKRNDGDFVLWKLAKAGEPSWDSPWGEGRPGWHIECSAMTKTILGLPFDIHGGGADLIFPHHEDEIAQSEAGYGKKVCNYWIHNGMVNVDGAKMGKSLNNFRTIRDLLGKYDAMVIRYFVVSNHYRKPADFSEGALDDARNSYNRLKRFALRGMGVWGYGGMGRDEVNKKYLVEFKKEMDDDLNTPRALAVLWKLVRDSDAKGKFETIRKMDEVLGLRLLDVGEVVVPSDVRKLARGRKIARSEKDWKRADFLRKEIEKMGWVVRDVGDGWELESRG